MYQPIVEESTNLDEQANRAPFMMRNYDDKLSRVEEGKGGYD